MARQRARAAPPCRVRPLGSCARGCYDSRVRHVYVHVPFCRRRCAYCDFAIAVRARIPAAEYVAAVVRELALVGAALPAAADGGLETLYLGGGTPSLLPPDALHRLLDALRETFPTPHSAGPTGPTGPTGPEITLEANPDDVTPAAARAWRRAGVNRVSLGAQSFDDRALAWMRRSHDAARIGAAVAALRDAGIANVSLDLIFALPAELGRDWERDLDAALALEPAHLSLYGLTVEERTPLARWIARGAVRPSDDERYAAEYLRAHERLARAGYRFYEVSNAARPGRESHHNRAYWSGRPYLGLGPAAHSFDGRTRRWNVAAWTAYARALAAGRSPVAAHETLSDAARTLERVYLALRTADGLAAADLPGTAAPLAAWERAGWVVRRDGRVRCTPEGWLRLDALVAALTGGGRVA
jgi:oxygen-independent coproporphyrinogen-3 oxidase